MKKSKLFGCILFLSCFILLAGCGKKTGDFNVYFNGTVTETADKIIIEGESNLLEGARLDGTVVVDAEEVYSETTELVDDKGNFHMELDHHKYGDAEVVVTFRFEGGIQEEDIIKHYGESGEKLEGAYVYADENWWDAEGAKKAEVRMILRAEDDKQKHKFEKPSWGERPEDYGDPRVRIEIDEITEDKEYFYVKGHTNLLEGSEIQGSYANGKTATTRVNPDGTFEMKIVYRYEEDQAFEFGFSTWPQWGNIKKHYGENGEKLIGNLVETSGNSQHIKLIEEYKHE